MKVTFLGTGTSQGVPVIGCECDVCLSSDSKDNRLRNSVLIEWGNHSICIDTGPDFRCQMLRADVNNLDAILYTHEHKDHIAGMDDVRPICFKHNKEMEIYANQRVLDALKREFHYVFDPKFNYPGIPRIKPNLIENTPFHILGKTIVPIEVLHYKLPVFGYRIEDFTYITDANFISEQELEKIKGSKVVVLNALQREKHISHFTLEEAINVIDKIKPERAYFSHVSHQMGKHEEVSKLLPPNIQFAYDGLQIEV